MRFRTLACGFALGAATALVSTQVVSQVAADEADRADLMKRWREFALPGEYHDRMEFHVGKWDSTYTIWMEGPDKPPVTSTTVVSNKLIFGGRFLETRMSGTTQMEFHGEKMEVPIEGLAYRGYDNFKKKYIHFWIDNGGTGIYYSEGTPDKTGNVTRFFSTIDEWQTGERDKPYKMVETIIDENTVKMVLYDLTMPEDNSRVFEELAIRHVPPPPKPK